MIHKRHVTTLSRFLEGRTAAFYHLWFSVTLAVGGFMDYFLTGLWLPRAGAIVAGVSAYVYFFDPRTTDDWWQIRQDATPAVLKREKLPLADEMTDPVKTRAQSMARRRALQQARIARSYGALAEARNISYREAKMAHQRQHDLALRAQAYWLFLGTLIWAFGDIPVELVKCGRVPC
jgi:hypothetical protein